MGAHSPTEECGRYLSGSQGVKVQRNLFKEHIETFPPTWPGDPVNMLVRAWAEWRLALRILAGAPGAGKEQKVASRCFGDR